MVQEVRKKQRLSIDEEDGAQAAADPPSAAPAPLPGAVHPPSSPSRLVLVWDLDETLLVFNSLLVGTFQAATQREGSGDELVALGRRWEAAILSLCDRHFFFDQLEEWDQCCLEDIQRHDDGASLAGYDFTTDGFPPGGPPQQQPSPEQHAAAARPAPAAGQGLAAGDRGGDVEPAAAAGLASPHGSPACASLDVAALTRLAYRYRRIARLFSFGLQALGNSAQRAEWESLYHETDAATAGWLSHAAALLAACSGGLGGGEGAVTHVAVTSGQLVPSLAKLLLFRLGGHIAAHNLWSSRHCGKAACFERVRRRFGPGCRYVAVGDGIEEDEAAAALGWPYVRVLLAPAGNYPAERVLSWRPDAATGGPGLPFTSLGLEHVARAAGVALQQPNGTDAQQAVHGGSAAARVLRSPRPKALG